MLASVRAACTFAGKSAISSRNSPRAAWGAVGAHINPIAPRISSTPVMVTRNSGRGKLGGTIRTRSGLLRPQCAEAVNRNMPARAKRRAAHHPKGVGTPKCPSTHSTTNKTVSKEKGIMPGPQLLSRLLVPECAQYQCSMVHPESRLPNRRMSARYRLSPGSPSQKNVELKSVTCYSD